jgi:hypothetical protein
MTGTSDEPHDDQRKYRNLNGWPNRQARSVPIAPAKAPHWTVQDLWGFESILFAPDDE